MSKYYFEMPLNGERDLGPEFKFMFPKFGVFAETKKEAQQEWKTWVTEFIKEVKAEKKKAKDEELPFEMPEEVNGVRMLKNKPKNN